MDHPGRRAGARHRRLRHHASRPPAPGAAAATGKTTIRIGSPFKPGHILVDTSEKFKELVETRSGGRIAVSIDAGTKSEIDINKLNSAGELEMQSNGTNFLELYAPRYYFFTGPYVMKDFDHYMRVWNGKLGQAARWPRWRRTAT